ncbi:MAG: hypothetical protein HY782_06830 [Chloroflexi bacterium]|nr:hypothetical protein [Chloroflexota bacterium]
MSKATPYRQLFFLYIWAEPQGAGEGLPVWRYRLEDPLTREQHVFSQLSALVGFLQARQDRTTGSDQRSAVEYFLKEVKQ